MSNMSLYVREKGKCKPEAKTEAEIDICLEDGGRVPVPRGMGMQK